jgi:dimethylglycine dehydrogenase
MDWLIKNLGAYEDVQIKSLTNDQTILVLAGPKARDVLSAVSRDDWSKDGFPWLSVRECFIGFSPATVMGVSFSGELAYEIHIPNASLYAAYLALRDAGNAHGLKLFGALAVESMRLEKGYLHWKADILTEFNPFETGLDRFVQMDKVSFVGKDALMEQHAEGPRKQLVTLTLDSTVAPAHGGASVMVQGNVVGTVTSGGWGYRVGQNLAYAFVETDMAKAGTACEIDVLGHLIKATVSPMGPYDATMTLVRG